ncbi:MAG: hypothetical protein SNG27_05265 [Rikenellaceae bacterium]
MKLQKIAFSIMMLLAFTTTAVTAQPGGGGGGMGGGSGMGGGREGMGRPEGTEEGQMPDLLEQAGYFEFDEAEIIKKIKVKDADTKVAVTAAVVEYSKGYEGVGIKYAEEIKAIKAVQAKLSQSQSDRNAMREMMQGTQENTQKIRTEMVALHKQLSEVAIPAVLNEKQAALWTKYYSSYTQGKGFRLNMPQRRQRGEGSEGGERPQRQE